MTDPDASEACWVCPSRRLPRTGFTTADRPSRQWPCSPVDGYRHLADGTPVCVHPGRLGLTAEHTAPPPPLPERSRLFPPPPDPGPEPGTDRPSVH